MAVDFDELERLNAARTSGEWRADEGDGTQRYGKGDDDKIMLWADADCDIHPVADCSANHTCREPFQCEANAAFIAAAANAMSELLRLARIGAEQERCPSTAPSDLAQQRDAEDVLQQKRDGADG